MNKSGDIVILNDLKKEREDVKKQYEEQKKKKFTDKHAILYCIGFAAVLVAACIICPANFYACSSIMVGYGFGVPCTYAYCLFSKEEKLKRKLDKLNKDVDKLEFKLVGIKVNHHYIDQDKGFVLKENGIVKNKPVINSVMCDEDYVQEESGPSLKLKKN
jgi:hypothetical protein